MAKLNEGATLDKVVEFFSTEKGPPPVDFDASQSRPYSTPVASRWRRSSSNPGSHALMCFITDRAGGPLHAIKAKMIQEVKGA